MIDKAKKEKNKAAGKICIEQYFSSEFIRNANDNLQSFIDYKKLWFASPIQANVYEFSKAEEFAGQINYDIISEDNLATFMSTQDRLIKGTKDECALIEVKVTAKGTQTFDLPQNLRRNSSPNRARKDLYSTLMLGCWMTKCFFDMINMKDTRKTTTFRPRMF